MRYVAVAVGLLLAGYGAVLIVLTSRLFARTDDAEQASKARWRRRREEKDNESICEKRN